MAFITSCWTYRREYEFVYTYGLKSSVHQQYSGLFTAAGAKSCQVEKTEGGRRLVTQLDDRELEHKCTSKHLPPVLVFLVWPDQWIEAIWFANSTTCHEAQTKLPTAQHCTVGCVYYCQAIKGSLHLQTYQTAEKHLQRYVYNNCKCKQRALSSLFYYITTHLCTVYQHLFRNIQLLPDLKQFLFKCVFSFVRFFDEGHCYRDVGRKIFHLRLHPACAGYFMWSNCSLQNRRQVILKETMPFVLQVCYEKRVKHMEL